MANLGTRTKNVNIVLRKNIALPIDRIKDWCCNMCDKYAFIKHENDVNLAGAKEGIHYHLVISLLKPARLSTTLSNICEWLEISPFGVEIDKTQNLEGSIQYLIHKNDPQKTQHDSSEIIHNWPTSEFVTIMSSDSSNGSLTFERILEVCKNSNTLLEVIESIGLGRYHLYRPTINDIWKECKKREFASKEYTELLTRYKGLCVESKRMLETIKKCLPKTDKKISQFDEWIARIDYYAIGG